MRAVGGCAVRPALFYRPAPECIRPKPCSSGRACGHDVSQEHVEAVNSDSRAPIKVLMFSSP